MGAALVGFIIAASTLNLAARYLACIMFASGAYCVNSCILGWVSATLGQTQEKKAVALSFVTICANISFIYTPYLYPASDGPRYITAMSANAAFSVGTITFAWIIRFWLKRINKRVENGELRFAY
jgi:hypothetical protein